MEQSKSIKIEKFKEFQLFCQFCFRKFHASSVHTALIDVDSHEQKCTKNPRLRLEKKPALPDKEGR